MKRILITLIVVVFSIVGWYRFSLSPLNSASEDRLNIKIPQGSSVQQIAELLEEKKIIRSATAFTAHVRFTKKAGELQAGDFILRPSLSVSELLEILQHGKSEEMSITIPEGYTLSQIDALMAEKGFTQPGELVDCANTCDFASFEFLPNTEGLAERGGKLEGYLFPETYFVAAEDFKGKFFLERLLTTFRHRILEEYAEQIEFSGRTLHEIVTMASLVEEETRTDEERAVVAGILWKRFDDGRGLGVDATVRYILKKPIEAITVSDLNTNSPYNTRKFKGLPPGPISTVSEKSIIATLNPEESDYWYYLHAPDGQIHYSETNEGHNINRNTYLR